jgi:prenylcysteine oxidase / farnesylcysteine lyase
LTVQFIVKYVVLFFEFESCYGSSSHDELLVGARKIHAAVVTAFFLLLTTMAGPFVFPILSYLLMLLASVANISADLHVIGKDDAATATATTTTTAPTKGIRIAVIGGALSGSLTAKYVAEWDASCRVSSITVFESVPIQSPVAVGAGSSKISTSRGGSVDNDNDTDKDKDDVRLQKQDQGTRVQTVRVVTADDDDDASEGALVEVGASIGYKEFHLILEHIRADPDHLKLVPPFSTGTQQHGVGEEGGGGGGSSGSTMSYLPLYRGLGIYNGRSATNAAGEGGNDNDSPSHQDWSLNTASIFACEWIPDRWRELASNLAIAWRYGWELRKLTVVTKQFLKKFGTVPALLADPLAHFFESPIDLWKHLGMDGLVAAPFDQVLEALHIPEELPAWRTAYLHQGSVRREFLEAMNLVNYNQRNGQVNAMVGFGSFAAAFGGLFAVQGGNVQLIASAYRQANGHRTRSCGTSTTADAKQIPKRVTTVIATTPNGDAVPASQFELFAQHESLGVFDIVVVAAPLQQARVEFYVQSVFDTSVLQPMPLGHKGVIDPEQQQQQRIIEDPSKGDSHSHQGHPPFPPDLDPASTRPYTQVVTTLVSNATLALVPAHERPRSIMMTARGKASLHNITAITQLQHRLYRGANSAPVSLYKVFSDERLSREALTELFGPNHVLKHVKVWPRPYGGATPDYQGGTTSERFVLYDATPTDVALGNSRGGGGGGGAIYYPVAMEQSTLACMELAAIGAKATAKLIARRLGLIQTTSASGDASKDEL